MDPAVVKSKVFSIESMMVSNKLRKLSRMMKPILKKLTRQRRSNAVSPSNCTYDVEECLQNELNEPFDVSFQFHEDDENARNEALEKRLQESAKAVTTPAGIRIMKDDMVDIQPVFPDTYFAVPVHFIEAPTGGFMWVPLADADIAPHVTVTELQSPCQQVPCVV